MKKATKLLAAVLLLALLTLSGCSYEAVDGEMTAMDTFMTFRVFGVDGEGAAAQLKELVAETESRLSVTDENSDIYRLNHADGNPTEVDALTMEALTASLPLCEKLDGLLDVTIYPLVKAWGFTTGENRIPSGTELDELVEKVDFRKVTVDKSGLTVRLEKDMELDLGAVAKGFLADKSKDILRKNGVQSALLNFGGTIYAKGRKPGHFSWKVGIADPDEPTAYFGYLDVEDKVISTSGGYERFFVGEDGETYVHIINPLTGRTADSGIRSVTVIADSGLEADALSTAFYLSGVSGAYAFCENNPGYDFVILTEWDEVYVSDGIKSAFKLADGRDDLKLIRS